MRGLAENVEVKVACLITVMAAVLATPEVTTTSGRIRGVQKSTFGREINEFTGIPFAKPPIGSLRFKKPVPVDPWTDVLNATSWPSTCYQEPFLSFQGKVGGTGEAVWNPITDMSEDCLYLNVWAPEGRSSSGPYSTMVWIFGGGFVTGTPYLRLYDGRYLAAYADVIVVSISYRVGPLGFLYLGNKKAPGNMGLFDQNLALQWINNNIEKFGGTKSSITLFGESAGGASVSYHLISPKSEHLFQRAIMQSGTALGHWAHTEPEVALTYAKDLGQFLNCNSKNVDIIHSCLLKADAQLISKYQWNLNISYLTFPFVPTTDYDFINMSPMEYIRHRNYTRKSLLMGVNRNEAVYFLNYYMSQDIAYPKNSLSRKQFLEHIPKTVAKNGLYSTVNTYKKNQILIDTILQEYTSSLLPGDLIDYYNILDSIGGDLAFKCPVIKFAQAFNQIHQGIDSKIFMYSFEHRTESNPWPSWSGVLHGDEIEYIFGMPMIPVHIKDQPSRSSAEKELCYSMIEYWSNFAKNGTPGKGNNINRGTVWPEYTYGKEEYLVLEAGKVFEIKEGLRHKECEFWMEYFPKLLKTIEHKAHNSDCTSFGTVMTSSWLLIVSLLTFVCLQ